MLSAVTMQQELAEAARQLVERVQAIVVQVRSGSGNGSGILWRADGQVVTNHHVVPQDQAVVETATGRRFTATVVARDPANDLALLVPTTPLAGLPAAEPGDSRALRVGQLVLAVGNPLGLRGAVSWGIITATPAARPGERELVRANILLLPGNSGGPLVDAQGRVVGVNAMVAGPHLGLAVPTHLVETVVQVAATPKLGLRVVEVALGALARQVGLAAATGVMVTAVAAGYPAAQAGVLPGDVIVGVNGQRVTAARELARGLARASANGLVQLQVLRGGQLREVRVPLLAAA
jgi:serine protease Do